LIRNVTVTGGSGFIGSHMVRVLLAEGCRVTVVDNFRTGRREFLPDHVDRVLDGSILDTELMMAACDGADWVVHFAANPDARGERRGVDFNLDQNMLGTARVLDAMHHVGADRIFYASTASVYGDTVQSPVPEDFRMVPQASFYGASKLAGEALIGAYCAMYGMTGLLGRWVHILGERYLHGHIIDFLRKLRRDPTRLYILGDGQQAKSGLHAANLCDGIWTTMQHHDNSPGRCEAYNFGGDTLLTVTESAQIIANRLGLQPRLEYSGRPNGGWVGDNPHLVLDSTKVRALGWKPTMSVPDGIRTTVDWLTSEECAYL
jgi:UDP-glucose 4-epimerase